MTAGSPQVWRDRERLRHLVVDDNDGIVAIAGVVEGVLGAGLGSRAAATAVLMATIAGGIALGGSKYTEMAAEWDARDTLIEEERRQLHLSPEQELEIPMAVWIDRDDHVRRLTMDMGAALAAAADELGEELPDGDFALSITIDFRDYGDTSIAVTVPDPATTVDITDTVRATVLDAA